MRNLKKKPVILSILCVPLMAAKCDETTLTYSQKNLVCQTADFFRFKPYEKTFDAMSAAEQNQLKKQLQAYRDLNCGNIK